MPVALTRLVASAKVNLPGALDSALRMEMFSVLTEFFSRSNCWYEDIAFGVSPPTREYTVVPVSGRVERVIWVLSGTDSPVHAAMPSPGEIHLAQLPQEPATYTARVALNVADPVVEPGEDGEGYPEFPDWVLEKYGNGLLSGLLSRMMSQIAKPYTSPTIALYHGRVFRNATNDARVEGAQQNVYRAQSWRFP